MQNKFLLLLYNFIRIHCSSAQLYGIFISDNYEIFYSFACDLFMSIVLAIFFPLVYHVMEISLCYGRLDRDS